MGILDDVVVNARSAAEAVGKKAGQLVDASKLRISLAEINAEVNKSYAALGEYVFESCRDKLADDAEIVSKMAQLDEQLAQQAALQKELTDKQNKVVCPGCGKPCSANSKFCSECGSKLGE